MNGVQILGTGHFLPEKVLTNQDLEKMVNTNDEWIVTRTGIKKRRILEEGKVTSDMCYEAGIKAIEMANLKPQDIDMIIVGTSTPDMFFPATACITQKKLGCRNTIPCFDFEIACTSFPYGMVIASQFIQTGTCKNVLFIAADTMSRILDYTDRSTCILFGDGASAVILGATTQAENKFLGFDIGADGYEPQEYLYIPEGGACNVKGTPYIHMNGTEIYRLAVKQMASTLISSCEKAGVDPSELKFVIPHQANLRIMTSVAKQLKLKSENLVSTIEEHGNTSGSTVGIALDVAIRDGRIKRGDLIGITAFGAGLSWGSAVFKY